MICNCLLSSLNLPVKQEKTRKDIDLLLLSVAEKLHIILSEISNSEVSEDTVVEDVIEAVDVDKSVVSPLIKELKELIADDDTSASDIFEQLEQQLIKSQYKSDVMELGKYIEAYEFDHAQVSLDELETKITAIVILRFRRVTDLEAVVF